MNSFIMKHVTYRILLFNLEKQIISSIICSTNPPHRCFKGNFLSPLTHNFKGLHLLKYF